MTRTMCDVLLLNSVATNYPTTYKGESVIEILEILFTDHEAQLKAKDEEIKELGEIIQQYLIPSKNYDAIIKAKDDEIERLKGKTQILEVLVDNTKDIIEAQTRMCRTKARSIVAMLFWEWRNSEARIYATNIKWNTGRAFQSQILFEAAYKILKEQQ